MKPTDARAERMLRRAYAEYAGRLPPPPKPVIT
jgi:hypothetical protein